MVTAPHNLIAVRRAEIERELASLSDRIAVLRAELPELEIAERVYSRLAGEAGANVGPTVMPTKAAAQGDGTAPPTTMPEMIVAALKSAAAFEDRYYLEPKEIGDMIRAYITKDFRADAVASICWRMLKRHQLTRYQGKYALPGTPPEFQRRVPETTEPSRAEAEEGSTKSDVPSDHTVSELQTEKGD